MPRVMGWEMDTDEKPLDPEDGCLLLRGKGVLWRSSVNNV